MEYMNQFVMTAKYIIREAKNICDFNISLIINTGWDQHKVIQSMQVELNGGHFSIHLMMTGSMTGAE